MGNQVSNTDNIGPNNSGQNNTRVNLAGVNFSGVSFDYASSSRVMNCGENPLRIYLHTEKLDVSSFIYEQGSMTYFKQDSKIPSVVIPVKGSESFGGRAAFASVFVQSSSDPKVVKATICVSAAIPPGRSFIVTPDYEIKLQKEGSDNKWLDEDRVDHTPK